MYKKFLGVAMFALSLFSVDAFAAATQVAQTNKTCASQTCTTAQNKQCVSSSDVCCTLVEFDGLNLTEAQKTQLKSLKQKQATELKAEKDAAKADKKAAREQRKAQSAEAKRKYLEEVKAIIGPDQYVAFLENIVVNGSRGNNVNNAKPYCKMPRNNVKGAKKGSGNKKVSKNKNQSKCENQANCTSESPKK